jgi:hypothetical protein
MVSVDVFVGRPPTVGHPGSGFGGGGVEFVGGVEFRTPPPASPPPVTFDVVVVRFDGAVVRFAGDVEFACAPDEPGDALPEAAPDAEPVPFVGDVAGVEFGATETHPATRIAATARRGKAREARPVRGPIVRPSGRASRRGSARRRRGS